VEPFGPLGPCGPTTFQLTGASSLALHFDRLPTRRIVPVDLSLHAEITAVDGALVVLVAQLVNPPDRTTATTTPAATLTFVIAISLLPLVPVAQRPR
jgi:hypothetical protein